MTILSAAFLLFLVMDPLSNIPVFLSVLKMDTIAMSPGANGKNKTRMNGYPISWNRMAPPSFYV